MDTAETLVRQNGFDGFSYADLADDIGIRKASIHYHFPSKADLSAALMERYREAMAAYCESVDATSASGAERICRMIDRYQAAVGTGDRLCLCVAFLVGRKSLDDETWAEIDAYRGLMRTWFQTSVAEAVSDGSLTAGDPVDEAAAILALLEGAQLAARAAGDPGFFDRAVMTLRRRLGC